jgi:uncharacterized protein
VATALRPRSVSRLVIGPPRSRTVYQLLMGLLALSTLGFGAVLFWFHLNEDRLVYQPWPGKLVAAPVDLGLDSQDVTLRTADGVTLAARVIPPPKEVTDAAAAWLLYFHGASGNIGLLGYNEAWAQFRRLGLGVLAIDYRGYGQSAGTPSENGLYQDADAAWAYLNKQLHVPPARIVIYGYSLGSAVAIDLATRVPAAGLIVEGALVSVPARAKELYPFLPAKWLARNRFTSVDKIAAVSMPKLFIHAREDADVPISHGQRLFRLARAPKVFHDVAGGHRDAHQVDPGFFPGIARFVAGLGLPLVVEPPPTPAGGTHSLGVQPAFSPQDRASR